MQFIFQKKQFFFRLSEIAGRVDCGVKPSEFLEVISIGITGAQQNFCKLKAFSCGNSRVFSALVLASTLAVFFPLR